MSYIVVYVTTPDLEVSKNIANILVNEKLAACVNITPKIYSTYYWQGNIEHDDEYLLIIKTREDRFNKLEERIKTIHPYSVPEIIALPIVRGSHDYLKWIDETLERDEKGKLL
ncbi:MAG: divalent-cation tolerance protein CutA [Aquificae bacterium]|nr:divalent-cation tolerance protein CutA [Aquificota bacterium]